MNVSIKSFLNLFSGDDEEIIGKRNLFLLDDFNYFYKKTNMLKNDTICNIDEHIKNVNIYLWN